MLLGPIAITSSLLNSLLILNKVGGRFNFSRLNLNCLSVFAERGTQKEKKEKVDRDVPEPAIETKGRLKL